jgi:hypothetical protein
MHHKLLMVATLLTLVVFATTAPAMTMVTETWVPDLNFGGGGYWAIEVTNLTGGPIAMVTVGTNLADVIFTAPALVGLWQPIMVTQSQWEGGVSFNQDPGFIPPDTSTLPWNNYFAGYAKALIYYVKSAGTPIANGATMGGFRFLSSGASSPYALFDANGNIVAQGETNDGNVPVEDETWGAIKALYR